ncbi:MAG: hypothetical protein HQL69_03375 [Magnetococcales bacterium]|nr:hypothetical protein [Magnetococcales bacterium]
MPDIIIQHIDELPDNRLYLIILVLLIIRLMRIASGSRFSISFINLFGTFCHELAHFLVGFLLWAKPVGFSLWPKRQSGGGFVLGSVSFNNITFFNAIPTALAPLLLIVLAYYIELNFFTLFYETTLTFILYVFIIVVILENAIPSATDFKVAFNNIPGVVFYVGGTLIYLYYDQVRSFLAPWITIPG